MTTYKSHFWPFWLLGHEKAEVGIQNFKFIQRERLIWALFKFCIWFIGVRLLHRKLWNIERLRENGKPVLTQFKPLLAIGKKFLIIYLFDSYKIFIKIFKIFSIFHFFITLGQGNRSWVTLTIAINACKKRLKTHIIPSSTISSIKY